MKTPIIADIDIPFADDNELILAYKNLVRKVANRYKGFLEQQGYVDMDDLLQAGTIGLLSAKEKYVPNEAEKFQNYAWYYINTEIRRAIGYEHYGRGKLPPLPIYGDKPNTDEDEEYTLFDKIPDETIESADDMIDRTDREEAVHEAVDRLCQTQKDIISMHFFEGKEVGEIADITGMPSRKVSSTQQTGIGKMRTDHKLQKRIMTKRNPYDVHVGTGKFNSTWTSATEMGVMILEEERQWQEERQRKWEQSTMSRKELIKEQIANLNRIKANRSE